MRTEAEKRADFDKLTDEILKKILEEERQEKIRKQEVNNTNK